MNKRRLKKAVRKAMLRIGISGQQDVFVESRLKNLSKMGRVEKQKVFDLIVSAVVYRRTKWYELMKEMDGVDDYDGVDYSKETAIKDCRKFLNT